MTVAAFLGIHRQDYKINGNRYTAIVDFNAGIGRIFGKSFRAEFKLDEYVLFDGNMEDFIKHHTGESK